MEHNLEIFIEILSDNGITGSDDAIKNAYESFTGHLMMMSDMRYDSHYPSKETKSSCSNCEQLEGEIKRLKPVSKCCGKGMGYERDGWICDSCGRRTIRVIKD